MTTRRKGQRLKAVALELYPETIEAIAEFAAAHNLYQADVKRAAIIHSLTCPLFLSEVSSNTSIQQHEGK